VLKLIVWNIRLRAN